MRVCETAEGYRVLEPGLAVLVLAKHFPIAQPEALSVRPMDRPLFQTSAGLEALLGARADLTTAHSTSLEGRSDGMPAGGSILDEVCLSDCGVPRPPGSELGTLLVAEVEEAERHY
jgi:hypothetical protein